MHITTDPARLPLAPRALARGCVATIGNFDGVHLGHQRLLNLLVAKARALGLPAVVITFDPHPLRVLKSKTVPPQIMSLQRKLECFAELGIDLTLVMPFTFETAALTPEAFVRRVLVENLNVRALVVGYDYAFGAKRRGNVALLKELGAIWGFTVEVFPALRRNGRITSSTHIRQALRDGNVTTALALLGRPHSVEGIVEHGMNRGGRLLGFPTANLRLTDDLLLPRNGVYAVMAEINPRQHSLPGVCTGRHDAIFLQGVASVGTNPTFGHEHLRVETHLLDFHKDIYDQTLRVHFLERLRDERTFDDVNTLIGQIQHDTAKAKKILRASIFCQAAAP